VDSGLPEHSQWMHMVPYLACLMCTRTLGFADMFSATLSKIAPAVKTVNKWRYL
jgi:hypothetical protein